MSKKRTLKYSTGQSYERTILKTEKFISKGRRCRWEVFPCMHLRRFNIEEDILQV